MHFKLHSCMYPLSFTCLYSPGLRNGHGMLGLSHKLRVRIETCATGIERMRASIYSRCNVSSHGASGTVRVSYNDGLEHNLLLLWSNMARSIDFANVLEFFHPLSYLAIDSYTILGAFLMLTTPRDCGYFLSRIFTWTNREQKDFNSIFSFVCVHSFATIYFNQV